MSNSEHRTEINKEEHKFDIAEPHHLSKSILIIYLTGQAIRLHSIQLFLRIQNIKKNLNRI